MIATAAVMVVITTRAAMVVIATVAVMVADKTRIVGGGGSCVPMVHV